MKIPYDLIGKFLSGEANETEIEQLKDWRNIDQKNEEEYLLILASWGHSFNGKSQFEAKKEQAFEVVEQMINNNKQKNPFLKYLISGVAAIIILAFGMAFLGGVFEPETIEQFSFESKGEKREVLLSDGSKVLLNRNSAISYFEDFNEETRTVNLEGEAFFEVAKNPDKPFIIIAGKSKTTVLGTAFNLKVASDDHVMIIVTEGKVQFSDLKEREKEFLTIGEKAELAPSSLKITKEQVIAANEMAWKTGLLTFNQTELRDVLNDLSKYYQVQFTCEKSLENFPVSVTIDQKSIEDTVVLLKNITGLNIVIKDKTYHITR